MINAKEGRPDDDFGAANKVIAATDSKLAAWYVTGHPFGTDTPADPVAASGRNLDWDERELFGRLLAEAGCPR